MDYRHGIAGSCRYSRTCPPERYPNSAGILSWFVVPGAFMELSLDGWMTSGSTVDAAAMSNFVRRAPDVVIPSIDTADVNVLGKWMDSE